ncbi:unnamed protein product, partial [Brenthis ino]
MEFKLSEICSLLGDRIEQYNSVAKKRRIERDVSILGSTAMKSKYARLTSTPNNNLRTSKDIHFSILETPNTIIPLSSPVSFSSATKVPTRETPIRSTPKRKVMRVHKKIISQPKRLIFYDSDDCED